ncbi:MAG TPA: hypothetical protein PKA13_02370 [Geminicoccaceae bacterium]|nr:hypothetical protein [Geminicoccus sp.]HMU48590.1 hypothetical protein [Geminicoccaceae bacterium]
MSMQRLFFGSFVATALLLCALIAGIGLWVDPFGHFHAPGSDGFVRDPAYTLNRALYKIVEFRREAERAAHLGKRLSVIVGDSMSNQIDPEPIEQASGVRVINLSYGQATLQENLDLLEEIVGRYPIEEIVWAVPFRRFWSYETTLKDEMPRALRMAKHPWLHLFTFESLRASWYVARRTWLGIGLTDPDIGLEGKERIAYDLYKTRVDIGRENQWPDDFVRRLEDIERRIQASGVRLAYAIMPVHPGLLDLYKGLPDDRYRRFQGLFADRCVIDLQFVRPGGWQQEQFRDILHLKQEHRPELARRFVEAESVACTPQ